MVHLLPQLLLLLLRSAQSGRQLLLADLQRRAPVLAVAQLPPGVREPLAQRGGLGLLLRRSEPRPLQLALQGAPALVGGLQRVLQLPLVGAGTGL